MTGGYPQRETHTVAGALAHQRLPIDEQRGIVHPTWSEAGQAFRDRDRHEPAQSGGGQRVQHQQAAGAQQPARFRHRRGQVRHVFEDLAGDDDIGAPVRQRHREHVAADRVHTVRSGLAQGFLGEVDADVEVAVQVGSEQSRSAPQVDQDGARTRGRDQACASGGEPVQHDERAVRLPPLVGEPLVEFRIVGFKIDLRSGRRLAG